jgi:very-short-patch-repair endonuclease
MTTLLIAIVAIVVIVFVALAIATGIKKKPVAAKGSYSYARRVPLTKNERQMYWRLVQALPNHVILAQVELSRCIEAKGPSFTTINGKSLDFVICKDSFEIVAGIEIDDKSHATPSAQKKDATKNAAMGMAGIALIRWPATPLPSVEKIQQAFSDDTQTAINQPAFESIHEKKIKILEQQLFSMARKLEQLSLDKVAEEG